MPATYLLATEIPLQTILIASLGLVAFVVVGLIAVSQVKKRMASEDEEKGQPGGFTLSDLRALHRDGQMTDEEYERAKGMIIDAAKRAAARENPANKKNEPGDPLSGM